MTLVLETGAGLTNANTYLLVTVADAYHTLRCNAGWSGDADVKEAALIRATEWIDRTFDFMGEIKNAGDSGSNLNIQALAWPRSQVFHEDNYLIDPDTLPTQVVDATAEAALAALLGPFDPVLKGPRVGSLTEQVGRISQTRSFTASGQEARIQVPTAYLILKPLLARGGAHGHSGLVRT